MSKAKTKNATFRQELSKILSKTERGNAVFGFDVLGKMALIEIPQKLQKKKKRIGKILLQTNPSIDRVYEKVGTHSGKYRIEKIRWLAGEKNPETIHRESGCLFYVNPNVVFFNSRFGTERIRIASKIKKNQKVVVFFAGVCPYPVVLAKHSPVQKILAIEWNKKAVPYARKNILLNKAENRVDFLLGDVGKIKPIPEFDHIVMPAPETALNYLGKALEWLSKKGGFIHVYFFVSEKNWKKDSEDLLFSLLKKWKRKTGIIEVRKVSAFSSSKVQVCAEVRVQRV